MYIYVNGPTVLYKHHIGELDAAKLQEQLGKIKAGEQKDDEDDDNEEPKSMENIEKMAEKTDSQTIEEMGSSQFLYRYRYFFLIDRRSE